ncbi:hypothetical protein GF386_05620 [Candidatus Pacearchaeota archaeon]|nr:hypothetical protein [Candidatus Pacearchaeota archaeon]MBD3283573.1 hypothetical protein [Candidatus Pacearchaeota archaeon]
MKLGEALSRLKKEQSRLARLISLRKENIYVERGKQTNFDPKKLSDEIDKKIDEIRVLKIKIQKTNLNTKIKKDGICLAEAILKINDLRSKIARLSDLFEKPRSYWYKEKEEKEMISQLDELKIEDEIESLEAEKTKLDNQIQITNWATELL